MSCCEQRAAGIAAVDDKSGMPSFALSSNITLNLFALLLLFFLRDNGLPSFKTKYSRNFFAVVIS